MRAIIFIAFAATTGHAWAVNKCTAPGGAVTYQAEPCPISAKTADVKIQLGPAVAPFSSLSVDGQIARAKADAADMERDRAKRQQLAARPVPTGAIPSAQTILESEQICRTALTSRVAFKDPESVRIGTITRVGRSWALGDPEKLVVRYVIPVNARNSYGGYTGDKYYTCELMPDEKSVFALIPPN